MVTHHAQFRFPGRRLRAAHVQVVERASTLAHVLRERAAEGPRRVACSFYADGKSQRADLTFGELDARASAIARQLQACTDVGDRALLLYPPGPDFITGLFGCLYAGVAAVPTYPPHPRRVDHALPRLSAIVENCAPKLILTTSALAEVLGPLLPCLATDRMDAPPESLRGSTNALPLESLPPEIDGARVAILQYTSGSTGTPRGVTLKHANLMANLRLIQQGFGTSRESVGVFWLPFYHDMGLIGGVLQTVFCGGRSVFLSPAAFVQSPIRWLQAISRERATISGAPNFAYEECVRRITLGQCAGLDLSCWKLAFCGAEPIRRRTLEQFAEKFRPYGFDPASFYPCYGLAEATLLVSGGWLSPEKQQPAIEGDALIQVQTDDATTSRDVRQTARPAVPRRDCRPGNIDPRAAWPDRRDLGFGPERGGRLLEPARRIARHVRSPPGRHERRALSCGPATSVTCRDGELFVTGRRKDMIIVGGRNHYPQDIELSAEGSHSALLPGGCAAFGTEIDGAERVVIAAEVDRHQQRTMCHERRAAQPRR